MRCMPSLVCLDSGTWVVGAAVHILCSPRPSWTTQTTGHPTIHLPDRRTCWQLLISRDQLQCPDPVAHHGLSATATAPGCDSARYCPSQSVSPGQTLSLFLFPLRLSSPLSLARSLRHNHHQATLLHIAASQTRKTRQPIEHGSTSTGVHSRKRYELLARLGGPHLFQIGLAQPSEP